MDVRCAIKGVHEARFRKWPSRTGTQIIVKMRETQLAEARLLSLELHERIPQLSPPRFVWNGEALCGGRVSAASMAQEQIRLGLSEPEARRLVATRYPESLTYEVTTVACNVSASYDENECCFPVEVTTVFNGGVCAILYVRSMSSLEAVPIAQEISKQTGIMPSRLVVLREHGDGSVVLVGE